MIYLCEACSPQACEQFLTATARQQCEMCGELFKPGKTRAFGLAILRKSWAEENLKLFVKKFEEAAAKVEKPEA